MRRGPRTDRNAGAVGAARELPRHPAPCQQDVSSDSAPRAPAKQRAERQGHGEGGHDPPAPGGASRAQPAGYTAAMPDARVVAILNTSEDIVALLSELLRSDGFRPVVGFIPDFREGRQDLAAFLREHDPAAIIWDIALPYDRNWAFFQQVSGSAAARGRRVVLTTTNKRALDGLVGPTPAHELVGKPYDIDVLLAAVHRATGAAPP